jgi:hypothetical protein
VPAEVDEHKIFFSIGQYLFDYYALL